MITTCEICRQKPCDSRCPNAENIIVGICEQCKEPVCAGYTYWTDEDNNTFCSQDCAMNFHEIRETEYD